MKRVYDGNALWVGRLAKSIMSVWLIAGLSLASWTAMAETITAGMDHTCMIKPDQSVFVGEIILNKPRHLMSTFIWEEEIMY